MSRPEVPHNRAALVLLGIVFLALAAGISSTWVDDGDGTCRALYRPNLGRVGCARKLAPAAFSSAALLGAGALSWDAARRMTRPPAGEILGAVIGIAAVAVVLLVMVGLDRPGSGGLPPGPTAATLPPPSAPAPTFRTARRVPAVASPAPVAVPDPCPG